MSDMTKTSLAFEAWTAITGCTKVSAGCRYCTCELVWPRLSANYKTLYYNRIFSDVKSHPSELVLPTLWKKARNIIVNPMSDTFHPSVSFDFIDQLFAVMLLANQHTYHVLTKRAERAAAYFAAPDRKEKVVAAAKMLLESEGGVYDGYWFTGSIQWPLPNVWIGVSVEDQKNADERIPVLLGIAAAVRYVAIEPFIGAVDLLNVRSKDGERRNVLFGENKLDWVTVGCETGSQRRKLDIEWVRAVRNACEKFYVPLYLKQLFLSGKFGIKLVIEPSLDGRQSIELPNSVEHAQEAA